LHLFKTSSVQLLLRFDNHGCSQLVDSRKDTRSSLATLYIYSKLVARHEWVPIAHNLIGHEPLTELEQWKVPRHRSLWVAVGYRVRAL